ncbi:MAG: imidazoleglycerol-phosphate dehydratase HisB [Lachnospiraceae bacterium]|nr:imidazoleglycerol-phosphate dehydratase HisB [Lachnospiraceae bacterium]
MKRIAEIKRKTKETDIAVKIGLDGTGSYDIKTGIGFFDHMLESLAKHGNLDLNIKTAGDLNVDTHHTVEDTGIVLGEAMKKALGNKEGINRYASFVMPMDDALVLVAIDLCNRPYLNFNYDFQVERVGYFETEMVREFFYALSYSAGMNIHIKVLDGQNAHHIIEAIFKAFANAFKIAASVDGDRKGVLSTKGQI